MDNILLKQIEQFISFLKKLHKDEIEALEIGSMKIEFVKCQSYTNSTNIDTIKYSQYVAEIEAKKTREECVDYFIKSQFLRKDLEGILKHLGVIFTKKDNKAKLQSKIIENTIGRKLRDEAIINK